MSSPRGGATAGRTAASPSGWWWEQARRRQPADWRRTRRWVVGWMEGRRLGLVADDGRVNESAGGPPRQTEPSAGARPRRWRDSRRWPVTRPQAARRRRGANRGRQGTDSSRATAGDRINSGRRRAAAGRPHHGGSIRGVRQRTGIRLAWGWQSGGPPEGQTGRVVGAGAWGTVHIRHADRTPTPHASMLIADDSRNCSPLNGSSRVAGWSSEQEGPRTTPARTGRGTLLLTTVRDRGTDYPAQAG